jgi:hypothetical protein
MKKEYDGLKIEVIEFEHMDDIITNSTPWQQNPTNP